MTAHLEIDRFGRILIPKALRDALALQPGAQLEVEVEGGTLHLRPAARDAQVTRHHGRLILSADGVITGDPVQDLRDERLNEVIGSW
ncbi:AbrB/MazE/SpoVT family DNA-binding domain-containing protein [Deinococcus sp. A31D244]|uniref:AbrB/MazE/SpoVT family DNA-binding domain-containing protein n=1 Tax=Deinococcus sp. A31D244 TaxID=3397675 RepID=UPI0039DF2E3E